MESLFALATGVAIAGLIASLHQLVTRPAASFRPLQRGPRRPTFAAGRSWALAALFTIGRSTIRDLRSDSRRLRMLMVAMVIAWCWSLLSGTVVLMAWAASAIPVG